MRPHRWHSWSRLPDLPADWRLRREAVLRRDGGRCYMCGQGGADAVDHVTPGTDHSLENLAAVHNDVAPYCHRYKTAAEGVVGRSAQRAKAKMPTEPHPGLVPE